MKTFVTLASWAVWVALAVLNPGRYDDEGDSSGPPPSFEALEACHDSQDGASCSFSEDEGEARGICLSSVPGRPAACVPSAVLSRLE
jgi:hypothetical protein